MSRENVMVRKRVTRVGTEVTFGVTPSMVDVVCLEDDFDMDLGEEMLDVNTESTYRIDVPLPVHGFQTGKIALRKYMGGILSAAKLLAAGTVTAMPMRALLSHVFGAEHAALGGTCASGTTASALTLHTGEGALFVPGKHGAAFVSGQWEWFTVVDVTGEVVTISPDLSGVPATDSAVINSYGYAPGNSMSSTLSVSRSWADSTNCQALFNGCYGNVSFELELGKLPIAKFDLTATTHTGPSAQAFTTTPITADMGPSAKWNPKVYMGATIARATTATVSKVAIEFMNGWEKIPDLSSAQGVAGAINGGGNPRAVKLTVTARFDLAEYTAFDADTLNRFVMVHKIGSGATATLWVFELPNVVRVTRGKPEKQGEFYYQTFELTGMPDTIAPVGGETAVARDMRRAPFRLSMM